ncbi:carbon-nitrogen hydrolase family protein, partial [Thermogutta sp.]|uniref:carbon-nitrogen hydrolase family protein n=1 Tax=Thermogutta sp. TaxID=1962930 RepID=UPI003C7C5D1C
PEGALWAEPKDSDKLEHAVQTLRTIAAEKNVYLVFGESRPGSKSGEFIQSARVVDPEGNDIFHYVKHHDVPSSPLPGTFLIDGVPVGAIICADRWLRTVEELPIQMGAQISIELSANFAAEWVPQLQWYWYVSRALRNNVWVIFANSAKNAHCDGHGHSAVIAPDGRVVASNPDNQETMLVCDIDPSLASRGEALARSTHPALHEFWTVGLRMYDGQVPHSSPQFYPVATKEITLAATTVADNLDDIEEVVQKASRERADLLVFPARSCAPNELRDIQSLAKRYHIALAVGIKPQAEHMPNRAVVIGSDGTLVTEYGQLSAQPPLEPGRSTQGMLFSVKGVPALLLVEQDILWTELIELAAVRGVRILIHLGRSEGTTPETRQQQLQIWATAASFGMFSAMADVNQAALWEDLNPRAERRAVIEDRAPPISFPVEIYSPFSANLIKLTSHKDVIVAKRKLPSGYNYFQDRVGRYPMLKAWLQWGSQQVFPILGP